MYEDYFGFDEKPFNLTPDPKFLYRSVGHDNALQLLQYAIHRREGFIVLTGDIGTGKTTLCRALLPQLDAKTSTALLLNPFLAEDDLLRLILHEFGLIGRDEAYAGAAQISKSKLVSMLNDFLVSLLPLDARAVLILDEAQNLPLAVLEQIRILSNLETEKQKLLQIILVGQLNLETLLRTPELRQLDQRISIRYRLQPLTEDETAAYIRHRLTIAKPHREPMFGGPALKMIYQYSGGVPRLINLLCDRALVGIYAGRTGKVLPATVHAAAAQLRLDAVAAPKSRSLFPGAKVRIRLS